MCERVTWAPTMQQWATYCSTEAATTLRARRPLLVAGGIIAAGLLCAGWGSSMPRKTSTTSTTVIAQRLAFVNCMRANGISSLPDPSQSGPGPG